VAAADSLTTAAVATAASTQQAAGEASTTPAAAAPAASTVVDNRSNRFSLATLGAAPPPGLGLFAADITLAHALITTPDAGYLSQTTKRGTSAMCSATASHARVTTPPSNTIEINRNDITTGLNLNFHLRYYRYRYVIKSVYLRRFDRKLTILAMIQILGTNFYLCKLKYKLIK
jgi:hypothetical protein